MRHLPLYTYFIIFFWLVFLAYWGISGFTSKKNIGTSAALKGILFRMLLGLVVLVLFTQNQPALLVSRITNPVINIIGVVLCGLGIGFAVWARAYLGKNWGMPMSVKENPDLVTSGPYSYVRHPIYSGMMLALFGTALNNNGVVFIIFLLFVGYFVYSAAQEEKLMARQFPEQYAAYKQRTKMLIPFIF